MTAITFSRQNDSGSRVSNTQYWENLVLVVVLFSESKALYFFCQDRAMAVTGGYLVSICTDGASVGTPVGAPLVGYTYNWNQYGHLLRKALNLKDLANLTGKKGTTNSLLSLQHISSYKAGVSNKSLLYVFNKSRTHFNLPNFWTNSVWVTLSKSFELTISLEISSCWPSSLRSLLLASYAAIENGCTIFKLGY